MIRRLASRWNNTEAAPKPRSNRSRSRDNRAALFFMAPWVIGFVIFTAGPLIASLFLSFTRYDLLTLPEWTGISNYTRLLERDRRFLASLSVTGIYVGVAVPLRLIFALAVAMALNKGVRGLPLYRAIYYLPSLLGGSVAIAILWRQVFGADGIFNAIVAPLGIEPRSWIGSPETALGTLIVLAVWQFGSPMIIFLAGLKQIPSSLYDAAEIDGAGAFQKFFRITLPLLTPVVFFNVIMQMISAFQAFTPAYIVSGGSGGPADTTLFYSLYLYQQAFTFFRMGYASAMAWILVAIIAVFTAINFFGSRYWVHYGDEGGT